jgi:hypothetical protein
MVQEERNIVCIIVARSCNISEENKEEEFLYMEGEPPHKEEQL